MPENVADLKLIIQASAPQSNGISRAYSKAVQIGAAREVADAMINLRLRGCPWSSNRSGTEGLLEVFLRKYQDRREVRRDARYCEAGVIPKAF